MLSSTHTTLVQAMSSPLRSAAAQGFHGCVMHMLLLSQAVLESGPGAVLIMGGTGALGTAVAGWLPARGARRLVLASRTGAATPAVRRLVARPAFGVMVTVTRADVGARAEAELAATMPIQVSRCADVRQPDASFKHRLCSAMLAVSPRAV